MIDIARMMDRAFQLTWHDQLSEYDGLYEHERLCRLSISPVFLHQCQDWGLNINLREMYSDLQTGQPERASASRKSAEILCMTRRPRSEICESTSKIRRWQIVVDALSFCPCFRGRIPFVSLFCCMNQNVRCGVPSIRWDPWALSRSRRERQVASLSLRCAVVRIERCLTISLHPHLLFYLIARTS